MIDKDLRARLVAELNERTDLIKLTPIEVPYFAALEKALGEMSAERKGAALKEVHAHLWAMVEAKRMDGLSESDAWRAALREFGAPEKVGRALWKQWIDSGQMEENGEPMTRKQKALKWGFPLIWTTVSSLLVVFGRISIFEACAWLLVVMCFAELGRNYYPRKGEKWSAAHVFLYAVSTFALLNMVFMKDLQNTILGEIRDYATLITALVYLPIYLRFRKRETARRPWQIDRKFSRNPIAAEQKYRMEPRIVLAASATFSCAFVLSHCLQFFGLPLALLMCAAIVGAAFTASLWVAK